MRHRKLDKRLGRSAAHRSAMVAALVCGLILEKRITTTLVKAKVAQRLAERVLTRARQGTLAARRNLISRLHRPDVVSMLMKDVVPVMQGRNGGYTRVVKLGRLRPGDGSEMAMVEWIGIQPVVKTRKPKADTTKQSEPAK